MGKSVNVDLKYYHAARDYAKRVVSGDADEPACKWVRLACQRQINDLEKQGTEGWRWRFDQERAWRICYFVEQLPHVKGRWNSKTIVLQPWQCFLLTTLFGWVDSETGLRRFRKALIVVPRKNAKTTIAAGVGLYMLAPDGEPGSEVYAAAVTRGQVTGPSGVWTVAGKMASQCPGMRDRWGIEVLAHSIVAQGSGSSFKPATRDADPQEGFNTHCAIIDELHAHNTREVFEVLDDSTGARKQPLLFIISTEGDNPTGVFAEQVAYLQNVLEGLHEDDSYFGAVWTIDPEMDWTLESSWRVANPNLGVSVFLEDLENRCRQARKNPASQSSFLTKRLNVRVGAGDAYFNMLAWNTRCKDPTLKVEDFYGKPCHIFLDLASKQDLCAKVRVFQEGGKLYAFGKYYLPEDAIERGHPNYEDYRAWDERDLLTITPGNVTDYEFIEKDLLDDVRNYQVLNACYDPFQATQFATHMKALGVPMIEYGMTVRNFSEPMNLLGADIVAGKIRHDGSPILTWMMGNVMAKIDGKGNVFPRKQRPENKIDGAVALIGARAQYLTAGVASSIYNDPARAAM